MLLLVFSAFEDEPTSRVTRVS